MIHSSFLFNYRAFQAAVEPLVKALVVGNPEPLQSTVAQIRAKIGSPENWILHGKGIELGDYGLINQPQFYDQLLGIWLLTVLSEFLVTGIALKEDWIKLACALRGLGWDNEDIKKIYAGIPVAGLFTPILKDLKHRECEETHGKTPWHLVRPYRSIYGGWLPIEEIARLRDLLALHQGLLPTDVKTMIKLPANIQPSQASISKQLDPEYWYERIPLVYQSAIEMLELALDNNKGLYMIVYELD